MSDYIDFGEDASEQLKLDKKDKEDFVIYINKWDKHNASYNGGPWIKLSRDIFKSDKFKEISNTAQALYFYLLCNAEVDGSFKVGQSKLTYHWATSGTRTVDLLIKLQEVQLISIYRQRVKIKIKTLYLDKEKNGEKETVSDVVVVLKYENKKLLGRNEFGEKYSKIVEGISKEEFNMIEAQFISRGGAFYSDGTPISNLDKYMLKVLHNTKRERL
jgi:hypothetical protein